MVSCLSCTSDTDDDWWGGGSSSSAAELQLLHVPPELQRGRSSAANVPLHRPLPLTPTFGVRPPRPSPHPTRQPHRRRFLFLKSILNLSQVPSSSGHPQFPKDAINLFFSKFLRYRVSCILSSVQHATARKMAIYTKRGAVVQYDTRHPYGEEKAVIQEYKWEHDPTFSIIAKNNSSSPQRKLTNPVHTLVFLT